MIKNILLLPVLMWLFSCATVEHRSIDISYIYTDNPVNERVDIYYKNSTDYQLCISREEWPNEFGNIHYGNAKAALIVNGKLRFNFVDYDMGYCNAAECNLKLQVNEELKSFLHYADFDLPEELRFETKVLEFKPKAVICS